jgi:hypothetical protein
MSIHYLADIPEDEYAILDAVMMVTQRVFTSLGEYSCSTPTGPRPGRIYRRNLVWPNEPHPRIDWRVFVCEDDAEPGWVAHRPYHLVPATKHQIRDARIKALLAEAIP